MSRIICATVVMATAVSLMLNAEVSVAAADAKKASSSAQHVVAIDVILVESTDDELAAGLTGSSDDVAARIKTLQSEGRITVIDRLRLTTVENQTAMVQLGTSAPLPSGRAFSSRGGSPQTSFQTHHLGTLLSATASVDGKVVSVEMRIEKSQLSRRARESLAADQIVPASTENFTSESVVRIPDGKTVLAGGLANKSGSDSAQKLVLASARILNSAEDAEPGDTMAAEPEKQIRVFTLQFAAASEAAKVIKELLKDDMPAAAIGVDVRTNSLVVSAENRADLEVIEALLMRLDHSVTKKSAPRRLEPAGQMGNGEFIKKGQWATFASEEGGYRIRLMNDAQKANAEKAIARYEEQRAKYREYVTNFRMRTSSGGDEPPKRVESPVLAEDLRNGQFLRVQSVERGFVELKGENVHAVMPLSSIRIILLGDKGDVLGTASRSRATVLTSPASSSPRRVLPGPQAR